MLTPFAYVVARDFEPGCNFIYQGMVYQVVVSEKFYDSDTYKDRMQVICKAFKVDKDRVAINGLEPVYNHFVFGVNDTFYVPYKLLEGN